MSDPRAELAEILDSTAPDNAGAQLSPGWLSRAGSRLELLMAWRERGIREAVAATLGDYADCMTTRPLGRSAEIQALRDLAASIRAGQAPISGTKGDPDV